jgi:hypothetical protein
MHTARTAEMRKAVASGDWPLVLRLWEAYAAGILEEIGRGTCTRVRMTEAREFLEWTRRVVLCSRAQAQNQLDRIHAARQYCPQPAPRQPSLRTSL